MKISELKKLIRESIKNLKEQEDIDLGMDGGMTGGATMSMGDRQGAGDSSPRARSMAQTPPPTNVPGTIVNVRTCNGGTTHQNFCVPNSAFPGGVQIGDHFKVDQSFSAGIVGRHVFVRTIGPSCSAQANGIITQVTPQTSCCQNCTQQASWQQYQQNFGGACTTSCGGGPGGPTGGPCMELYVTKCYNGGNSSIPVGTGNQHFPCPHVDGTFATTALVGQQVTFAPGFQTGAPADGDVWTVDFVGPNPTYPASATPNSQLTTQGASCSGPSGPTGCPGCNSGNHTWGNLQNWITQFGNNMTNASWFNAPNQPCQFLANRITHWQGIQATLGGCNAYYNQLECKIKHVQATLQPQYNC